MADTDALPEFLASAIDAAQKAGELIRKAFYETKRVEHKGQVDLVTETDKQCEELIFNHLKQIYPTHKFIGEETTAVQGASELTDEPTWIVDPVDGTTNFVHGFPFVCVSIGLTIQKVPTIGVVYNPILNELFTAITGKGAFLNGNPIKVSSHSELISSLLCTECGTKREKSTVDAYTKRVNGLLPKVRSLRACGSLALNLCGVACGRLDICFQLGFGGSWYGFYTKRNFFRLLFFDTCFQLGFGGSLFACGRLDICLQPLTVFRDVAAGAVIVREAGGVMYDPSGAEFDLTALRVAASNPSLKDKLVEALRQVE